MKQKYMEKITILMTTYNEKIDVFKLALESMLNQTYDNIEILIIVDNPDNYEIINYLKKQTKKDSRIKVIINSKNIGLTKSLNKAIKLISTKYVARMDADDISEHNRLEKQIDYLKNNSLDIVGSEVRYISEDGQILFDKTNKSHNSSCLQHSLRYDNQIAHPSWLLKTEVYLKLDGYRDIPACEDYDFLLRAINHGYRVGVCDSILLNYRINELGISRKNLLSQRLAAIYISRNYKRIDDVTISEVLNYIDKKCTERQKQKYNKAVYLYDKALNNYSVNKIKSLRYLLEAIINSKYILNRLYRILRIRICRLIYK